MRLEKDRQARGTHLDTALVAAAASNDNMAAASNDNICQLGPFFARNETYCGRYISAVPQQLPTQSIMMALAMPTV